MGLTQVRKNRSLTSPTGEVLAELDEKDVVGLNRSEIILFSKFHEMGQKFGFTVVCQRCDSSIRGANNDSASVLSVACKCREFRFVR